MSEEYSNAGTLICDYVPWCRCLKCDPGAEPCRDCGWERDDCQCDPEYYDEYPAPDHECGEDTCVGEDCP